MKPDRLRELLHYEPKTGKFTWIVQRKAKAQVGTRAGADNGTGRIVIRVDGIDYYAHRLAWMYVFGHWPNGEIDHIDHNPSNNAIANLRESDRRRNSYNRSPGKGCFKTASGKWQAYIRVDRKLLYLGLYKSESEAHATYLYAKSKFHTTWRPD